MTTEKLQKVLARAGLGSRRELETWISAGRVSVNGQVARLGDRVSSQDKIAVDGRAIELSAEQSASQETLVLMYHKPEGEVCTRKDPEGRPTVFAHLPKLATGRWVMVGRLDFNTSGLLLFTNNGELAHQLMHPSFHLTRVYAVRVYGNPDQEICKKLLRGVELEDGPARFDSISVMNLEKTKLNKKNISGKNNWFQVSISNGRNRIVRRLWESQGIKVSRLIRLQYGPIKLPKTLQSGSFIQLSAEKLQAVYELLKEKG